MAGLVFSSAGCQIRQHIVLAEGCLADIRKRFLNSIADAGDI